MITSYEVGAVFKIADDASPALRKILSQVRALNKAVKESTANISAMMKSIGVSMDPAISETRALAAEWKSVSLAAQGARRSITSAANASMHPGRVPTNRPRLPGIGGGSGGGGGGAGFHVSPLGAPIPGGHVSYRGGSNVAMAGAGMLGYGAYMAAQNEDAVWQMIFHSGLQNTKTNRQRFRDIITEAHSKTGMPLEQIREAALEEIRMFRGTPGGGIDVLPEMLQAAATEARTKSRGSTVEEGMKTLIGLAHMKKEYGPEAIKQLAPYFSFLSSSTAATLPQIERAAGYAVPILQSSMEIDPMQTMLMGIALQRAGITNTKSGTWLKNMARNAFPGTSLMSRIAFKKHEEALKAFGLVDNKPDLIKMLKIASSHATTIPLTKRAAYEKALFGEQGSGGFAVLSDPNVLKQINSLQGEYPEYKKRYQTFWEAYTGASTAQQGRKSWADLQNVLIDLGEKVLPPVNGALRDFDTVLQSIRSVLPKGSGGTKESVWAKVGASALEGAAAGALAGSFFPGIGTLTGAATVGAVSGGLKAGEIWLGLDNETGDSVKKFGGSVSDTGKAAAGAAPWVKSLGDAFRAFRDFGATPLHPGNSVPAPPPTAGGGEKHGSIYMDGRKVGEIVSKHQSLAANGPLNGSAHYDGSATFVPADYSYARS